MTLDVRGGLKNTEISSNKYVALEEILSNSIDSYLIRRNAESSPPPLSIEFTIEFSKSSLLEESKYNLAISCTDNGAGFGNEQVKAFVTKDSTYKDYLNIQGIGKCKGAGRIQFFHYFNHLKIDSTYLENHTLKRRTLDVLENTREISESHFKNVPPEGSTPQTTIKLLDLKATNNGAIDQSSIRNDFSAHAIRNRLYTAFLQRFIILKGIIGDFSISIIEKEGENSTETKINSKDLPNPNDTKKIPLTCTHGSAGQTKRFTLNITRYSLPFDNHRDAQHEVALCANSALVCSLIKYFLKKPHDRKQALEGNFELILVESDYLEDKVNLQRDGFNIPKECSTNEEIEETYSLEDIVESLEDYVFSILTPKDFDRSELIKSTQVKFGISSAMLDATNIKIHYSDTEANIAKRVLKKYQEDIIKETSEIFDLKQKLLGLDPRSQDFREKINELSWMYTSTVKKIDMANLSQLVVRRSSMVEVLKHAIKSMLSCQNQESERQENEKIIHNIFFPTGKDSNDSIDHDIWILNEEYHYFDHISSDKPLASIPWKGEKLFSSDIDSSLEELFAKNNKDHRLKRPDIAIFNEEGAAIIIEFKAPGVELQEHTPDLVQYARLLAAKSNGKIKKFYGYLIGDSIDETRIPTNYEQFPSGLGYFGTGKLVDQKTGMPYGELYSEILLYESFVDRAENRLKVYKKKLNLGF